MKKITTRILSPLFAVASFAAVISPPIDAHALVLVPSSDGAAVHMTNAADQLDVNAGSAQLNLEHVLTARSRTADGDQPAKKKSTTPRFEGQLNINTATSSHWQLLPGVGPAIAGRILAHREKRSFSDPLHLLRVKGIGRKTFAKMQPYLSLKGENTLRRRP
jgi:DNA uptake protein ComE-like DNA-binding protein